MDKTTALEYLREYESICSELTKFSYHWKELVGDLNDLKSFLRLEDMFLRVLEEVLGLEERTLWNYKGVDHLISVIESKKEKVESQ